MIPLRPASRRRPTRAQRCVASIERMEERYLLSSYQVLNTNDSGTGSLRQAILDADANPGADTITFAIPAPGPNTIRPLTPLPTISDPVTIAGTTQAGSNGRPIVEIDGSAVRAAGYFTSGLVITASNTTVQGLVINRFPLYGIDVEGATGGTIAGNFIGTDVTGASPLGNSSGGILLNNARQFTIGGRTGAAGNLISGNGGTGVVLTAFSSGLPAGNVVVGNRVGTDITGTTGLPNGGAGILVNSTGNQIGGTAPGEANVIAFNAAAGVQVGSFNFQQGVVSNPIRGNSILGNGGLGIDLGNSGVNFNSPGFHTGPNQLQNFPTLITAYPAASGGTTIEGGLDSVPNSNFTIDFYSSITPDPSGFGEGQTYLGSTTVMTRTDGHADFTATVSGTATPGMAITATTTDATNNTSEFSHFVTEAPTAQADLGIGLAGAPDPVRVGQDLTYTINVTNAGPANATGVTVTDTLPANTTFVSAMPSQGSFAVDTTAGVLTANLGTLRNGASATVQVVVQPTMTGTGTLTSTASIRSDQNDPNQQNNTAVRNTTVIPAAPADLAIAQVALPDPVAQDGQLTYTIPVTNLGPGSATEVIVTDAVPSGVVFVSAKASQGTAGLAADGSVTANLGTLAPGQAALVTVVVQPTAIGTVTNTVSVQANQPDFNPANNRATSQTQVLTDVIPPTILAQRLIVSQQAITGIVLTFSQPMNPLLAASVNNYQILSGNGAGTPIPLTSARYNAARQTVTLIPQRPLVLGQFYELTANGKGAPGLTDLAGNVLDGDQNGLPDGIFTTTIGRGTSRRPLRFQADQAIPHPAPAPPHHPRPHPAAPQPHVPRSPQGTAVSTLILSVQRQHSPGG